MISGFETNILNNMKTKIEESKNKFSLDQIDNVKKLQDMFDKRVEELKEKITKMERVIGIDKEDINKKNTSDRKYQTK